MSAERAARRATNADLVGSVHSFGPDGPAYEVVSIERDDSVLVRVVESGETLRYPAASVRDDPEA